MKKFTSNFEFFEIDENMKARIDKAKKFYKEIENFIRNEECYPREKALFLEQALNKLIESNMWLNKAIAIEKIINK